MKHLPKALAAFAAACTLALAGCTSNSAAPGAAAPSGDSGAGGGDLVTVEFGSFNTGTGSRQVLYALEAGYFEEEGLDVRINTQQSTATLAQLLATGDADIAYVSYQPAIDALEAGIDIRAIATVQAIQPGMQTLWAQKDGAIASLADLAEQGGSVAVASVGGYSELLTREALAEEGLDAGKIQFIAVPPPEMSAALARGDVAVAALTPPSAAGEMVDPASEVAQFHDFADTPSLAGMVQGGLWANGAFADENGDVIASFLAAVEKAAADLEADPEKDRQYLAELGKLDPALVEKMTLEDWVGEVTADDVQVVIEMMIEHGLLEEGAVHADDVVVG